MSDIVGELRDAAARGRLLVITGAGISRDMTRRDGSRLPSWGELVEALALEAKRSRIRPDQLALLDHLLPPGLSHRLHGDALIEASEILKDGFAKDDFNVAVARLCREKAGETSETHRAIASINPAGIITFNYDRGHETAFAKAGTEHVAVTYDDDEQLKSILARRQPGPCFVLKAHGCIQRPPSLVLTSSSYREVLSTNRAYRAFLHHALISYTVLIVGFAMRDRDFDQLLSTMEIELGAPVHSHAFIVKEPSADPEGTVKRAEWSAVSARFGITPIYVPDFPDIPRFIRSLGVEPGPLVQSLVGHALGGTLSARRAAHRTLRDLGPVGRQQVRSWIEGELAAGAADSEARSELIYSLCIVADPETGLAERLVNEFSRAIAAWSVAPDLGEAECVAHALLGLRRCHIVPRRVRQAIRRELTLARHLAVLHEMDTYGRRHGQVPRLATYAAAASAEIESRARA